MEIIINRIAKKDSYTISKLSIQVNNDIFTCDTLEDTDRGINSTDDIEKIKAVKIKGKTAIPYGRYEVTLNVQSPKFSKYKQYAFCNGYLPRLIGVPGFEGILIHIGNKPEDTEGCILVGENKIKGSVINSTTTFKKLYKILKSASDNKEKIYITIK